MNPNKLLANLPLLLESIHTGIRSLSVNKFRTLLSLLGITVGIYSIITVFAMVDSLERNIRESVQQLGNNVVYIQKWPWGGGGEYPWWKYLNRPEPRYDDFEKLSRLVRNYDKMVYAFGISATAKALGNQVEGATVLFTSHDYLALWNHKIWQGRFFTEQESRSGAPVCVLGYDVAEGLFPQMNAVGQRIQLKGKKLTVIGVFEKTGRSLVGNDNDQNIVVPVNFGRKFVNENAINGSFIMVRAPENVTLAEFKDELRQHMRAIRRLKPRVEDNFALNEISLISSSLDQIFRIVTVAGIFIGGFSILVGGFGIANIMFVSVKERTSEIGIRKALGAPRRFILGQFLTESVALCLVGGLIGLVLVFATLLIVAGILEFPFYLSTKNVVQGVVISVVIGLISGYAPARSASLLDPVEAIRQGN
ncbi:MAG: ABC transporter permease [Thermaurantimonas sp.]|uniref:ABC transporter permease n=1 Tax=Thermaurantimonas sp. TaxID=2681568 RepID=UPI0039190D62